MYEKIIRNKDRVKAPVFYLDIKTPKGMTDKQVQNLAPQLAVMLEAITVYPEVSYGQQGKTRFVVVLRDLIAEPFTDKSIVYDFPLEGLQDGWLPVAVDDLGQVVELPVYTTTQGGVRMLIAGSSGSGKSSVPAHLLYGALRAQDTDVWLADPGLQTFSEAEPFVARSAVTVEEIIQLVRELADLADERINKYVAAGHSCWQRSDGKPILFILEELAAYMETNADKKSSKVFEEAFTELAQRGRKAGISICASMQISSTNAIPSAARSQFDIRIAHQLPNSSDTQMILPGLDESAPQPHQLDGEMDRETGNKKSAGLFVIGGPGISRPRLCRSWHINQKDFVNTILGGNDQ